MLKSMEGYWRGIVPAGILFFIAARLCFIAHHGFMAALEHGWWTAALSAVAFGVLWPLPVLLVIALLVWILPPGRLTTP